MQVEEDEGSSNKTSGNRSRAGSEDQSKARRRANRTSHRRDAERVLDRVDSQSALNIVMEKEKEEDRVRRRAKRSGHKVDSTKKVLERADSQGSFSSVVSTGSRFGDKEAEDEFKAKRQAKKSSSQKKDPQRVLNRADSQGSFNSVVSTGSRFGTSEEDEEFKAKRRAKRSDSQRFAQRVLVRAESQRTIQDLRKDSMKRRSRSIRLKGDEPSLSLDPPDRSTRFSKAEIEEEIKTEEITIARLEAEQDRRKSERNGDLELSSQELLEDEKALALTKEAERKRRAAQELLRQAEQEEEEARMLAQQGRGAASNDDLLHEVGEEEEDDKVNLLLETTSDVASSESGLTHKDENEKDNDLSSKSDLYLEDETEFDSEEIVELSGDEMEIAQRTRERKKKNLAKQKATVVATMTIEDPEEMSSDEEEVRRRARDRRIRALEEKAQSTQSTQRTQSTQSIESTSDGESDPFDDRLRRKAQRIEQRKAAQNALKRTQGGNGENKALKKAEQEKELALKREALEARRLEAQLRREERHQERLASS